MKKATKYFKIGIGLVITVVFMWYAMRDISFAEIFEKISGANHLVLIPILAIMYMFFFVKALRWKYLLSPIGDFSVKDVVPPMMVGFLGNNILPLRLGELVRVVAFCKKFGSHKSSILSTLVLERIFDIFSILILLVIGIVTTPSLPPWCRNIGFGMGIMALVVSVFLFAYTKWTEEIIAAFEKYFSFLPEKIFRFVSHNIEKSAHGLHSLRDTRLLLINALLSIAEWIMMCATVYFSLIAFNISLPFSASLVVNGVTAFGVAIPSSPGFFGVIEAIFSKTLALFNVSQIYAVSSAIYYHLISYIAINIVGFYYLHKMGLSLSEVGEEAEDEAKLEESEV